MSSAFSASFGFEVDAGAVALLSWTSRNISLVEDYDDYANSPCMPSLNRGCLAVVLGMFELQRNESRTANVLPSVHCKLYINCSILNFFIGHFMRIS